MRNMSGTLMALPVKEHIRRLRWCELRIHDKSMGDWTLEEKTGSGHSENFSLIRLVKNQALKHLKNFRLKSVLRQVSLSIYGMKDRVERNPRCVAVLRGFYCLGTERGTD